MSFAWMSWYDLTEAEYQQELAARQAKKLRLTNNDQQSPPQR
jgi:hypothetical protein